METHVGEVLLRHGEDVGGVGQVDVAALVIGGHVLGFAAHEAVERSLVVALDPAGFVEGERIPATLRAVLVQQAVLDDLELQLPDGADDLAAVEAVGEELRGGGGVYFDYFCLFRQLHAQNYGGRAASACIRFGAGICT